MVNAARGEAGFEVGGAEYRLRPTFAALVAAEEELGPLFALVERAASGALGIGETARLFWHCIDERPEALSVAMVGEAIAERGLSATTPALKILLSQILKGR